MNLSNKRIKYDVEQVQNIFKKHLESHDIWFNGWGQGFIPISVIREMGDGDLERGHEIFDDWNAGDAYIDWLYRNDEGNDKIYWDKELKQYWSGNDK